MLEDFSNVYHADLHGNVQKNPTLSGTTHNVFGIKVGVGITVAVRRATANQHCLHYFRLPETWRKEQKLAWLSNTKKIDGVEWQDLPAGNWLRAGRREP